MGWGADMGSILTHSVISFVIIESISYIHQHVHRPGLGHAVRIHGAGHGMGIYSMHTTDIYWEIIVHSFIKPSGSSCSCKCTPSMSAQSKEILMVVSTCKFAVLRVRKVGTNNRMKMVLTHLCTRT